MSHEKLQSCIDACLECAIECEHCSTACLQEDDVKLMANCIQLERDCIDICITTARLLARGSKHGMHLMAECAEICDASAEECEKHSHLEHCKKCAAVCRSCAEECRSMATEAAV